MLSPFCIFMLLLCLRLYAKCKKVHIQIGLLGECEDGDSMLRAEVFNLMLKDIDLGLSTIIPNDDPADQRHTLRDYLAFSSEAHFNAIEVSISI